MDSTIKLKIKRLLRIPFPESRSHLLIHCAHHKVGTVWFERVLKPVASHYGLPFIKNDIKAEKESSNPGQSIIDNSVQGHRDIKPFCGRAF